LGVNSHQFPLDIYFLEHDYRSLHYLHDTSPPFIVFSADDCEMQVAQGSALHSPIPGWRLTGVPASVERNIQLFAPAWVHFRYDSYKADVFLAGICFIPVVS